MSSYNMDTLLCVQTKESESRYLPKLSWQISQRFQDFKCEEFKFINKKAPSGIREFHMDEELLACDKYLSKTYKGASSLGIDDSFAYADETCKPFRHKEKQTGESDSRYQEHLQKRRIRCFKKAVSIIKLANEFNLKSIRKLVGKGLANLMKLSCEKKKIS